MTLVSPSQSNPGEEINAADINGPVNQIAAVVNGNLDDTNISSLSGTKITAGTLPASAMNAATNIETRFDEALPDFIASGCVWSAASGLDGSMTTGVVYVDGKRATVGAIASHTFTASKDTYVSVSNNGTVSYSEVANNAAIPTIPANSIWLAKLVTSGSAVTSVTNFGGWQPYYPSLTNVTLGNGVLYAVYSQVGKTVHFRVRLVYGTTSSASGIISIALPVTASSNYTATDPIGTAYVDDAGVATYTGTTVIASTTTVQVYIPNTSTDTRITAMSNAKPMNPGSGDRFSVQGTYEAA